jgi:putative SOS response-associated peptidase YedK
MCGRFTLTSAPGRLGQRFALDEGPEELAPRYNIAPSQDVLVVANRAPRALRPLRWGLVPSWAKDSAIGHRMINARAETLAERPAFRSALARRRCLIPADGFYEWQRQGRAKKQPFHIRSRDGAPLAFAGLWELWRGPDGVALGSCVIITTAANALLAPIHDRMPAILPPEAWSAWLDPAEHAAGALTPLLVPCPDDWLEAVPVSTHVNSPAHDDPQCLAAPLS